MVRFRINHARVISQANVIRTNADDLAAQLKLLQQMEQDCRAAWQGPAGETFRGKLAELHSEMTVPRSSWRNWLRPSRRARTGSNRKTSGPQNELLH